MSRSTGYNIAIVILALIIVAFGVFYAWMSHASSPVEGAIILGVAVLCALGLVHSQLVKPYRIQHSWKIFARQAGYTYRPPQERGDVPSIFGEFEGVPFHLTLTSQMSGENVHILVTTVFVGKSTNEALTRRKIVQDAEGLETLILQAVERARMALEDPGLRCAPTPLRGTSPQADVSSYS